jgi:hypothetical protein
MFQWIWRAYQLVIIESSHPYLPALFISRTRSSYYVYFAISHASAAKERCVHSWKWVSLRTICQILWVKMFLRTILASQGSNWKLCVKAKSKELQRWRKGGNGLPSTVDILLGKKGWRRDQGHLGLPSQRPWQRNVTDFIMLTILPLLVMS